MAKSSVSTHPKTRAQRRVAYRRLRNELAGASPLHSLASVRLGLAASADGKSGVWFPDFTLAAFAQTLKHVERQLRAHE